MTNWHTTSGWYKSVVSDAVVTKKVYFSLANPQTNLVAIQAHFAPLQNRPLDQSTFRERRKIAFAVLPQACVVSKSSSPIRSEWLSLQDLSAYSGGVTKATLRSWIHLAKNPLPATQVGNKIWVRRDDFDRWMQMHPVKPQGIVADIVVDIFKGVVR